MSIAGVLLKGKHGLDGGHCHHFFDPALASRHSKIICGNPTQTLREELRFYHAALLTVEKESGAEISGNIE